MTGLPRGDSPVATDPLRETLETVFGFRSFRPGQEEVVRALAAGEDAFVLMPTGGGKSLCYQLPALVRPGTALVVSPLIALMKDQVDSLRQLGVAAACYHSALGTEESRRILARLHAGELDLLYVAPERLLTDAFLQRLRTIDIALVAIDEAHCISQWGHDFRPEYLQLPVLRQHFPGVPLVALTATADPQTRRDIVERLGLERAHHHVASFDRPNIRYTVLEKVRPFEQLRRFLARHRKASGIVYALSRKRTEQIAEKLSAAGLRAAPYHAGLPDELRHATQEAFLRDDIDIVVATVAFGMGIDKPNVRFVVHYDLPKNLESYYQETGRAGRDGLASEALLLFGYGDIALVRGLIEQSDNPEQVRIELHKLNAMVAYAEERGCRRRALLGYFGESLDQDCGNCDTCLDPPETFDATEDARKALSCVFRVGQRFGIGYVVEVLRGADNDRVRANGHHQLSTWGIGRDQGADHWTSLLRQLVQRGYLQQDIGNYSVLKLTEKARPLLRGEESIELARPRMRLKAANKPRKRRGPVVDCDAALFERLRARRKQIADAQGIPPYMVFSDATLAEMAAVVPQTAQELLQINGVGLTKLERFGGEFLDVLTRPLEGA
ncbi:MAG: DNA helicase RecQ [Geothermobacteraceae bacterium]